MFDFIMTVPTVSEDGFYNIFIFTQHSIPELLSK